MGIFFLSLFQFQRENKTKKSRKTKRTKQEEKNNIVDLKKCVIPSI